MESSSSNIQKNKYHSRIFKFKYKIKKVHRYRKIYHPHRSHPEKRAHGREKSPLEHQSEAPVERNDSPRPPRTHKKSTVSGGGLPAPPSPFGESRERLPLREGSRPFFGSGCIWGPRWTRKPREGPPADSHQHQRLQRSPAATHRPVER